MYKKNSYNIALLTYSINYIMIINSTKSEFII